VIVSHRHRLIFLKTRKTAGTSIEIGLSKFCGPADIITRDTAADQALRDALGYPGPQNEYGIGFADYRLGDWRRLLLRRQRARFKNHMPAERVRVLVGATVWRDYYKVCVERNPWDKAVSLYYWRTRDQSPRPTLLSFLQSVAPHALSNYRIYAATDGVLVDHVIRYEQLAGELETLRERLGLPEPIELPRAKAAHRPPAAHYSTLVGAAERAIVDRVCAREIALFGYRFDASAKIGENSAVSVPAP
jgi:hypothetical protein